MRHSSLDAQQAREFDKILGCRLLHQNPDLAPVGEAGTANVPSQGTRMMITMTNPHVNHPNLHQLPLRIIRGKRELGRTTITLRRPNRSSLHGLLPLMLLRSLLRQLKPADPTGTLRSLVSQEMCMVINILPTTFSSFLLPYISKSIKLLCGFCGAVATDCHRHSPVSTDRHTEPQKLG